MVERISEQWVDFLGVWRIGSSFVSNDREFYFLPRIRIQNVSFGRAVPPYNTSIFASFVGTRQIVAVWALA